MCENTRDSHVQLGEVLHKFKFTQPLLKPFKEFPSPQASHWLHSQGFRGLRETTCVCSSNDRTPTRCISPRGACGPCGGGWVVTVTEGDQQSSAKSRPGKNRPSQPHWALLGHPVPAPTKAEWATRRGHALCAFENFRCTSA